MERVRRGVCVGVIDPPCDASLLCEVLLICFGGIIILRHDAEERRGGGLKKVFKKKKGKIKAWLMPGGGNWKGRFNQSMKWVVEFAREGAIYMTSEPKSELLDSVCMGPE